MLKISLPYRLFIFYGLTFLVFPLLLWKDENIRHQWDQFYSEKLNKKIEEKIYGLQQHTQQALQERHIPSHSPFSFFIFYHQQLKEWNNHSIEIAEINKDTLLNQPSLKTLNNGDYVIIRMQKDSLFVVGLFPITEHYTYENKYLKHRLSSDLFDESGIVFTSQPTHFFLHIGSQPHYYYVTRNPFYQVYKHVLIVLFYLWLITFLYHLYVFVSRSGQMSVAPHLVALQVILWLLFQLFEFPWQFIDSSWFSPELFAHNAWQKSPGQLFFNFIFLFFIQLHCCRIIQYPDFSLQARRILFLILLLGGSLIISLEWKYLLENSTFSYRFDKFYLLDLYSMIATFLLIIPVILWVILSHEAYTSFTVLFSKNTYGKVGLSLLISYLFLAFLFNFYVLLLFPFNLLLYIFINLARLRSYNIPGFLLSFITASLTLSLLTANVQRKNEQDHAVLFAKKMSDNHDPLAEYLFNEVAEQIKNDKYLADSLPFFWTNPEHFNDYLIKKYFGGYWNKYKIRATFCDSHDSLNIQPGNILKPCISYFETILFPPLQESSVLHYVFQKEGSVAYAAAIPYILNFNDSINEGKLFLEFYPRFNPQYEGFPELLVKNFPMLTPPDIAGFSFAKYIHQKLEYAHGEGDFPEHLKDTAYIISNSSYNRYLAINGAAAVMVMFPDFSVMDILTLFSYFFLCALVFFLCISVFFVRYGHWPVLRFHGFGFKLQLALIGTLTLFTLILSITIISSLRHQHLSRFKQQIEEKTNSIQTELSEKISSTDKLSAIHKDFLHYFLTKLSNVFFIDIHLYDLQGNLFATSRQEIFQAKLSGPLMNPEAMKALILQNKRKYLTKEKIGSLSFYSYYFPLYNEKGEKIGIVNLPFFAKQHELEKELNLYLSRFINLFIILFILTAFVSYMISEVLMRPLILIKNKIESWQLKGAHEIIEWHENDEIGSLVEAYNNKVKELARSVEELAKSERESAWREMAKQVAHEIKNPLTPMKLRLQLLKKAIDNNEPDLKERTESTIRQMIEQIDTLAHIASEFSLFAKMPQMSQSPIVPYDILKDIPELFRNEQADITFSAPENTRHIIILGDKEHFLRAINNLVQNALQAIPEDRKGIIQLSLEAKPPHLYIKITDNGKGIDPDFRNKIFQPNFTTKNTGMGLGLAMVKTIVENLKGTIDFTSEVNVGTTFVITLPIHSTTSSL